LLPLFEYFGLTGLSTGESDIGSQVFAAKTIRISGVVVAEGEKLPLLRL
jgi:hypothetical protein